MRLFWSVSDALQLARFQPPSIPRTTYSANFMQKVRKCLLALQFWRTIGTRSLSARAICETYSD